MTDVKTRSTQRRDIEGLRAVAVGVVLTSHLVGIPAGGFVGVDIFFVISGFLITGILVRESERTGRISFREFYARRIRRIIPAAFLTLLVTCIAARVLFFDSRAQQTYADAAWAALSLANWKLASDGTDYFQSTLPPSAVQQYWSLSVEEQFYLVWPVLIIVCALIAHRLRLQLRAVLAVSFGLLCATSFLWGWWQTPRETTVAYFSTFTRAWELALGGLLALIAPHLVKLPRWASVPMVWIGMIWIGVSTVITGSDATFPVPAAAHSVLATVLVIAGGCASRAATNPILENPVAGYIGRISYSLYLWHWPVIIMTAAVLPEGSMQQILWALALSLALSIASFHLVEHPIRELSWLSSRSTGRAPKRLSPAMRRGYLAALAAAAVASVVTAVLPQSAAVADAPAVWPTASGIAGPASAQSEPEAATEAGSSEHSALITAAIKAQTWPALNPSLDVLASARAPEWGDCGNVDADAEPDCRYGNLAAGPEKTVVVLGDSIAISWLPAVRAALEPDGWLIQGLTFGECPAARIDVVSSSKEADFTAKCAEHQQYALDRTKQLNPALVLVASTDGVLNRIPVAASPEAAADLFQEAQLAALQQLVGPQTEVVVLAPPPTRKDLPTCATRVSKPKDCLSNIGTEWKLFEKADQAAAASAGVIYVDTRLWTCSASGQCPSFIGTTPVMADGTHLTGAMSAQLGPLLKAVLPLS